MGDGRSGDNGEEQRRLGAQLQEHKRQLAKAGVLLKPTVTHRVLVGPPNKLRYEVQLKLERYRMN